MHIRPLTPRDQPFLWDMLYHAIYVEEGKPRPSREIIYQPEISRYVVDWMQHEGDAGFAAVVDGKSVGAVWLRCWSAANKGYGYVGDAIPELSIALLPGFRGEGIGTRLLQHCLREARKNHAAISLSVSGSNPAKDLYQREGFAEVRTDAGGSITMLKQLLAT